MLREFKLNSGAQKLIEVFVEMAISCYFSRNQLANYHALKTTAKSHLKCLFGTLYLFVGFQVTGMYFFFNITIA